MLIYRFSGGKYGSLLLQEKSFLSSSEMIYQRVELGFRIQDKTEKSFFIKENTRVFDPKYKMFDEEHQVEFRTFCACRDGETVVTHSSGWKFPLFFFIICDY